MSQVKPGFDLKPGFYNKLVTEIYADLLKDPKVIQMYRNNQRKFKDPLHRPRLNKDPSKDYSNEFMQKFDLELSDSNIQVLALWAC